MRTLIQSTTRYVSSIVVVIALVLLMMPGPAVAQDPQGEVKIEWLTWSFFRITSPRGKVILTNPWLSNPDSRTSLEQIDRADITSRTRVVRTTIDETSCLDKNHRRAQRISSLVIQSPSILNPLFRKLFLGKRRICASGRWRRPG